MQMLSKSGSGPIIQLVNKGDQSAFINPVFTITSNNWAEACDVAARRRCYPKVRQKSKSSGASPQRNPQDFGFEHEFINIVTSTESVDQEELLFGDEDYGSRSSHSHSHSNPYLTNGHYYYYGSNSKLLQVPSTSTLYYPCTFRDLSPEEGRQQRSSSITVPLPVHESRRPARCSSELVIRRRCSSFSPQGRNNLGVVGEQSMLPPPRICASTNTSPNRSYERRGSYLVKRRRSSSQRRPSFTLPPPSTSSSSSELDHKQRSPSTRRRRSQSNGTMLPRQRTLSMPNCAVKVDKKVQVQPQSSVSSNSSTGESYDVVIIGSPNVGKISLGEYFKDKGNRSGEEEGASLDQGIGLSEDSSSSSEDNESTCDDQDLLGGRKAIVYKPLKGTTGNEGERLSLRIFCQQTSAVNHLYKYNAIVILYSVTDRDSFEFARKALSTLLPLGQGKRKGSLVGERNKVVILVGNKSDLERSRCVSCLEGRSLATAYDVKFIEISSSLGIGIKELQDGIVAQILLRKNKNEINKNRTLLKSSFTSTTSSSSGRGSFKMFSTASSLKGKAKGTLVTLKLAQRVIDKIMKLGIVGGSKTKSCLNLHSL